MISSVKTEKAPEAIGPYSQGVIAGDFLFLSGQLPIDPKTGKLVDGGIEPQTVQVFDNIRAVLLESGLDFEDVVKTTVYLDNMGNFEIVNSIYGEYFKGPVLPARCAVEVAKLPKGASIEIELIAYKRGVN